MMEQLWLGALTFARCRAK